MGRETGREAELVAAAIFDGLLAHSTGPRPFLARGTAGEPTSIDGSFDLPAVAEFVLSRLRASIFPEDPAAKTPPNRGL